MPALVHIKVIIEWPKLEDLQAMFLAMRMLKSKTVKLADAFKRSTRSTVNGQNLFVNRLKTVLCTSSFKDIVPVLMKDWIFISQANYHAIMFNIIICVMASKLYKRIRVED